MVSGKYVYTGKKRCAKYQKFILIPDNASWYTAIHFESLIKASYKIVKRLFCLNYILQKYHRSVSNVAMVCVAAVALGSSTYAWFVSNNEVSAKTTKIKAQSNTAFMSIEYKKTAVGTTTTNGAVNRNPISVSAVGNILRNITYTGNTLLQKTFIRDPISRKKVMNTGELPQYFVKDTHEAIIDMDTFERLQEQFARNREMGRFPYNHTGKKYPFTMKVICGRCKRHYTRQLWNTSEIGKKRPTWVCTSY